MCGQRGESRICSTSVRSVCLSSTAHYANPSASHSVRYVPLTNDNYCLFVCSLNADVM